jgi:hypothetical protein
VINDVSWRIETPVSRGHALQQAALGPSPSVNNAYTSYLIYQVSARRHFSGSWGLC